MALKDFYDRLREIAVLHRELDLVTKTGKGRMVVVTGRRRVGKTFLVRKAMQQQKLPWVYLFSMRKLEAKLAQDWAHEVAATLNIEEPVCDTLVDFMAFALRQACRTPFVVIIDECQELDSVNSLFWPGLQELWDTQAENSPLLLLQCGSVASALRHIFQDYSQPLYGRVSSFIKVQPFPAEVIDEMLQDAQPRASEEELLLLYVLTGGVARYLRLLLEGEPQNFNAIVDRAFADDSMFLADAEILLANEFRLESPIYRTLLEAMGHGVTKREELQNILGATSVSGYLHRLETQFDLITQIKPVFARSSARGARYEIKDRYLLFWMMFVLSQQTNLNAGNYAAVKQNFLAHYETFSGRALEQFFREKLLRTGRFAQIGNWWDRRGQHELDIVAVDEAAHEVHLYEVKRNPAKANRRKLEESARALVAEAGLSSRYRVRLGVLSLKDMRTPGEELQPSWKLKK